MSDLVPFPNRAISWFIEGEPEDKRLILETVGSNLFLKDKLVNVEARSPFRELSRDLTFPQLLAVIKDVRQLLAESNEETARVVHNIEILKRRFAEQAKAGKLSI